MFLTKLFFPMSDSDSREHFPPQGTGLEITEDDEIGPSTRRSVKKAVLHSSATRKSLLGI